ncbi:hypothetical protein AB0G87_26315 [Streptomyces asoensis]|uniref:hypothetical protein n=1 Tax=Streptomyces asoensis TaxID=249586 RepID=UPI0033E90040
MSIIVSPQLNNLLFVLIGEKMLQADEDLAYRSHQPYKRLGKNVRELSDLIEQSVFGVGQALPPQVGRQYVRAMRLFVDNGGTNYLREFARQLDDVGDGRVKISMDIMEAKWSIIAELVRLLIELTIIAALSFFTGGASSSQTATAKARSRVTILATLDQLLKRTHLLPSLSEAFDEAFQTFVVRLAMMTMAPPGRRPDGFDWKQIVEDGFFGAVTGMFHGAFESLTKNLGKGFRNILDGPDASRFGKNNTKNITDDITSKFDDPPRTRSVGDRFVRGTGEGANEFLVAGGSEAVAEIVVNGVLHGKWEGSADTFLGAGVSSVVGAALFAAAAKFGGAFGSGFDFGSVNVLPVTGDDGSTAGKQNAGRQESDDDRARETMPTTSTADPSGTGTPNLSASTVTAPRGGGAGTGTVPTSSAASAPSTTGSGSGTPQGGGARPGSAGGAQRRDDDSDTAQEDPTASGPDVSADANTGENSDAHTGEIAPTQETTGGGSDSGRPDTASAPGTGTEETASPAVDVQASVGGGGAIPTVGTTAAPTVATASGTPTGTGQAQGHGTGQAGPASGTASPQRANRGMTDASDTESAAGSTPGSSSANGDTDVVQGAAPGPATAPPTTGSGGRDVPRPAAPSQEPSRTAPEPVRPVAGPRRAGDEGDPGEDSAPPAAPTPVRTLSSSAAPAEGPPAADTVTTSSDPERSPTASDTAAAPVTTSSSFAPPTPLATTSAPRRTSSSSPAPDSPAAASPTPTRSASAEPSPASPVPTESASREEDWDAARSAVPPVTRSHTWTDPVSTPPTADGRPTRYTVDSSFDVRRFTHDGEEVVDLTVELALTGSGTVTDAESRALWDRMAAGVQRTFNDPGHRLATGERLHVTVVPAVAGRQPHLNVELTDPGSGARTSQHTWRSDATAQDLAHEIGHQLGLRDENRDATAPQRPHVDGSLMGLYQRPVAEDVAEDIPAEQRASYARGGLRPRHLSLLSALVGGPDDPVGPMPRRARSEGADPLAPVVPSSYVETYGSRRDGNVGLVQVEPLPARIVEGLHQHVLNLLGVPAEQQATHPVREQLRRDLGGEQLVLALPYLLSSMGHRLTVDVGGRRRTVDVRLALHDPVPSPRQGTRDPSDPDVRVERRGVGAQESGDTESSGTVRTLSVPWSATLPVPAAGPVRGVDFGPSLALTHNQLSLSTSVTRTVQTTTAQRSNELSHAFSYGSSWQARVDTARMAPTDNWGPASELGPVTVWFPEHLAARRETDEPLPQPADLDELPVWGVDTVKEPHQLLEMVNSAFHDDLATLSDSSAEALEAFLSEPVLRGTLPMQRSGGIFSPLLLDSRGRAVGMLKVTTEVTPGTPTHQSQDTKINLESHLVTTVKVDGQAKVTNAVGVDLGVGPAFTGSRAAGHPDAAGKVAGSVMGKGGVRWQTSDTLTNGGSASVLHALRSNRSHLLTPAEVRHTVTLVRPGGGESPRTFGPWADGMQLRLLAKSDAAGKVPEGEELRSLPPELEHLRSIGVTAAPLVVDGPQQLFAHAEVWLRANGFLPASTTTTSRTSVLPDEALVQAQLNNLRRFEQARSDVGLLAAADAMVDGGHALWMDKPTATGTRRVRLDLNAVRDTTPQPLPAGPGPAEAPARPSVPPPARHVRTLPAVQHIGLTSFGTSGTEQQSSGYGWTAGLGAAVSGPVGSPGRGSGTLGPGADYAYAAQISHSGTVGAGLAHDQLFIGSNQGSEVFDIPARFTLDLYDGPGAEPAVRFAEHTAATSYVPPGETPPPAGTPPTAVTGTVRVAVPHHRTLTAAAGPAPRPQEARIREATADDRAALATTGPDGRPLEGVVRLPDDAVLDVFHGSGDLQEAVRRTAAGTHPGRPQPGWAAGLGATVSGMSPDVLKSAASLVAATAAGRSAADPTTLAAEVRHAALSPANLTARGHQIFKGSYVIEGVTLPGLGADQEYSLEISGVLRNPRLMHSAKQYLETGVSSSDTAAQQKSVAGSHQGGAALTGTRTPAAAGPADPAVAPPKRPDVFGPSAKYTYTAKSEDSATLTTATAVNRTSTESGDEHRIGADALLLVTVRGGTRNVVGNTLGLGSGTPVTLAVELPQAVQFLMTDGQLARHAEWFTGVEGLPRPQRAEADVPLPGRFARTGEPGLAGVLSVTQLGAPHDAPGDEPTDPTPTAAGTPAEPTATTPSEARSDAPAATGDPVPAEPGDRPAPPEPVERRNRLYDELIALVEAEAPGVTRPGHSSYLPGVASRIADYTSPTGLRALPGRGPRGVQRFHFRHLAKGGARLVEVTLSAGPRADAEERRTVRGRNAGAGTGLEQYHAHQPAGAATGTTDTTQHALAFNPTTRYPQPGHDTRTDRSGPALSAATTRSHGTKSTAAAEDRFWLRTDSVADFDLDYDYRVGVRSELVADWPPNVLGGMVQGWFLPSAGEPDTEQGSGVGAWISRTLGDRPARSAVVPARVTLRFTGSEAAEGRQVDPPLVPEVRQTPPVMKGNRYVPTGPAPVFDFNAWPELTTALNTVAPGQDRSWRSLETSTSAESTAVRIGELIQAGEIALDHPRTAAGLTDSMPGAYPFESAPGTPPSLSVTLHNPRPVTEASDVTLDRLRVSSTAGGSSSNGATTGGISFQGVYSHDDDNQAAGGATIPVLAGQPRTTGSTTGASGGRREWLKTGTTTAPADGSHGTRTYEALVDTLLTVRGPEGTRLVTGTATVRVAERDVLGHGITPPRTHPQVYDLASMVRAGADGAAAPGGAAAADLRDWRTHPLDALPDLLAAQIDPADPEAQLWLAIGADPAAGDGTPARPDPQELGRALFAASQTAVTAGKPVELAVRYDDGTIHFWNFDSAGRPSGLDPEAATAWQRFHTEASDLTRAAREEQENRRREFELREELDRQAAVLTEALREVDLALAEARPAAGQDDTAAEDAPSTRPRMRLDRTPRFTVPSRFDVRRFRHEGETITDLTVTVAYRGGDSTAVHTKLAQGIEDYYNAPGHHLPNGDRLHITVQVAAPGSEPHLTVDLVGSDKTMDHSTWHRDADPIDYAHELGHQLGLRDEYQDDTTPHRPDITGSLLGNYHRPAPDALPQGHLRERHLHLLAALIGDTDAPTQTVDGDWEQTRDASVSSPRSHQWIDPVSEPLGPADDTTDRPETDTVAARMWAIPTRLQRNDSDDEADAADDDDWDASEPTTATTSTVPHYTWTAPPPAAAQTPAQTPPSPEPAPDDEAEQSEPFDPSSLVTYVLPDSIPEGAFDAATLWSLAPEMEPFAVVTSSSYGMTIPMRYMDERATAGWADPWDGNRAFDAVMEPAAAYLALVVERAERTQTDPHASGEDKAAAKHLLRTNKLLEDDGWRPEYRSEFLRMQMLLRESGLLDALPRELVANPDWSRDRGVVEPEDTPWALVDPADPTGPVGGSLRGPGGVSAAFHTWLNANGGDSGWLAAWASDQAGGSINTESQRFKVLVSHFRPPKSSEGYHLAGLSSGLRNDTWLWEGRDLPVTRFDPQHLEDHATYIRSMVAQHAFTYEVLNRVKMPNVDAEQGIVQLIRLERRDLLEDHNGGGPLTMGQPVEMRRGPAESYSLLTPYKDPTDESSPGLGPFWVTSQKVPLHRVFGTYLQSRAETDPDHSLLLGEGENEFLALGEGAAITYHGTDTPSQLPVTTTGEVAARAPRPGQRSAPATVSQSPPQNPAELASEEPAADRTRLRAAEAALEAAGLRADELQQKIDTALDPRQKTALQAEMDQHADVVAEALREVDLALAASRPAAGQDDTAAENAPAKAPRMRLDRTPRFTVPSRFDVRRLQHEGETITDLTVTVAYRGGDSTAVHAKLAQGVEDYYNAPGHHLPNGDRLHITVQVAAPGTKPHLTVDLSDHSRPMDHHIWHHDADPIDYAHELGHQLGLRDEYQDDTTLHRPDITGSLLGNYHRLAPDALPQGHLRERHLHLLTALIGDAPLQTVDGDWKQARDATAPTPRAHKWIDPVSQPLGPAEQSSDEVSARVHAGADDVPAGPFTVNTLWSNAPELPVFGLISMGSGRAFPLAYLESSPEETWSDPEQGHRDYNDMSERTEQYLGKIAQRAEETLLSATASTAEKAAAARWLKTNSVLTGDGWRPEYRSEFLRMQMLLEESERFDGLPRELVVNPDWGRQRPVPDPEDTPWALVDPADPTGPVGGSLRGPDGVSHKFHRWLDEQDGSSAALGNWAYDQASGSVNQESRRFKALVSHFRPPRAENGYFLLGGPDPDQEWSPDGNESYPVTVFAPWMVRNAAAQHAFTYEVLNRVSMPNVDAQRGVVQLIRLEKRDLLEDQNGGGPLTMGQPVEMRRGPAESYSLLTPYKDPTDESSHTLGPFWVTSQEVPLHHVFGTFLQSRPDSHPDRSLFLGEGENEFLALGEGAAITYHGTDTPPQLPAATPGEVAAQAPRPGRRTTAAAVVQPDPQNPAEAVVEEPAADRTRLRAAEAALEAAGLRADELQQKIDTALDPRQKTALQAEMDQHADVVAEALREVDLALAEVRPAPGQDDTTAEAAPAKAPRMRLDGTPRFTVPSRFDVRRLQHEGETITDLTVTVAYRGGDSTAVHAKLAQGIEDYYNTPGHHLPNGDRLHITVQVAAPGSEPHLTVDLVGSDKTMDHRTWHHDADPIDYAHELGHQLGLRDEYQDDTTPHRPDITGSLLGNYHRPAPDALPQGHLRERHLHLLTALIGDTDAPTQTADGDWKQARDTTAPTPRSHQWIDPVSQPLGPADDTTDRPETDTVAARMWAIPTRLQRNDSDDEADAADDDDWDASEPTTATTSAVPHYTWTAPPPAAAQTPAQTPPSPEPAPDDEADTQPSTPPPPAALPPDALPAGPFTAATLWSNAPELPAFGVITLGDGKTYPMLYPEDRGIADWTNPYEGVDAYELDMVAAGQYLTLIVERAESVVADADASPIEKAAAERLLKTNALMEGSGWLPEYRTEFLRMQMLLGESDVLAGLPARLEPDSDLGVSWALTDPTVLARPADRPVGGSLRGENGVSSRFHSWLKENGGDSQWLADWAVGQGAGSIHASSQYFKVMVSHFRPPRAEEGYHMSTLGREGNLRSDVWENEHGREFPVTMFTSEYVRSMAAQHAFTYEVLNRVSMPNVDPRRGVVQLIRLEERKLLAQYNETMPAEGGSVHMKRGPAESYSLMEPYKDATKTEADEDKAMLGPFWVTSQEIPLHHVFGTYLQSRAVFDGEPWSEHSLFLREDENEFLALGEGSSITYHGTATPPRLSVTAAPPQNVSARAPFTDQGSSGGSATGNEELRDHQARRSLERLRRTDESSGTEPTGDDARQSEPAKAARARRYAAEKALEEAGRRVDELRELLDSARERQRTAARAQKAAAGRLAGLAADVNDLRGTTSSVEMPTGSLARTPARWPEPGSRPNPPRGLAGGTVQVPPADTFGTVAPSPEESFSAALLREVSPQSAPEQDGGHRDALNRWLSERISALEADGAPPVPGLPTGADTADLDEVHALGVVLGPGQAAEASLLGGRISVSAAQLDVGQRIRLLVNRATPGSYPQTLAALTAAASGRNVVIVGQDGVEHSQGDGTGDPIRVVFDGVRYSTPSQSAPSHPVPPHLVPPRLTPEI